MGLRIPAAERRNYKDSIRREHVAPPLCRRRSGACGNKTQMRPIGIGVGIGTENDPDSDPDSDSVS